MNSSCNQNSSKVSESFWNQWICLLENEEGGWWVVWQKRKLEVDFSVLSLSSKTSTGLTCWTGIYIVTEEQRGLFNDEKQPAADAIFLELDSADVEIHVVEGKYWHYKIIVYCFILKHTRSQEFTLFYSSLSNKNNSGQLQPVMF